MEQYAKKCGADFNALTDDWYPDLPIRNKWRRVGAAAYRYDRTLFLDADVLIQPTAPNIFEHLLAPQLCIWNDWDEFQHDFAGWHEQIEQEMFRYHKIYHSITCMPNTGVMMLSPQSAGTYAAVPDSPPNWWADQIWLAWLFDLRPDLVHWINEDRWHWQYIRRDFWHGLKDAWFIHLDGCQPQDFRIYLLKRFSRANFEKIEPPDSVWKPKWK